MGPGYSFIVWVAQGSSCMFCCLLFCPIDEALFLSYTRVGNGISFWKNSAEWTRNGFLYSAEESALSEGIPRKTPLRSSERNGTEFWEKLVFRNSQNNLREWFACTSKVVFSGRIFEICSSAFCCEVHCCQVAYFRPDPDSVCEIQESLLLFFFRGTEFLVVFSSERNEIYNCITVIICQHMSVIAYLISNTL
jgi:hypothetical protein